MMYNNGNSHYFEKEVNYVEAMLLRRIGDSKGNNNKLTVLPSFRKKWGL